MMKGDTSKLKAFAQSLRAMPTVVAQKVAAASAPQISDMARASFAAGVTPYGDAWAPGADGHAVTLVKSGRLRDSVRFVSIGTKVRAVLGVKYARYQVGKRKILPNGGSALPTAWSAALKKTTADVCRAALGAA